VTEIVTFVIEIEIVTFVMIVSIGIAIVMNARRPELTMTIRVVLRVEMNMGVATVVTMVMAGLVPDLLLDMAEDHLPLLVLHHALSTVAHIPQVRIAVGVEVLFVTPGITEGDLVHPGPEVLLFALNLVLMVRILSPLEVDMDDIKARVACI